jgi:hypothetical protein
MELGKPVSYGAELEEKVPLLVSIGPGAGMTCTGQKALIKGITREK